MLILLLIFISFILRLLCITTTMITQNSNTLLRIASENKKLLALLLNPNRWGWLDNRRGLLYFQSLFCHLLLQSPCIFSQLQFLFLSRFYFLLILFIYFFYHSFSQPCLFGWFKETVICWCLFFLCQISIFLLFLLLGSFFSDYSWFCC